MTLAGLSLAWLRSRPLPTALVLMLFALGLATITLLLLAATQLEERMGRDARGIDLVAGAKGSPLQLVLSAVYHLDIPTGNIPLAEANELARDRAVKKAIPLALGDSYRGYRIVGTNHDYPAHYGARLAAGRLWEVPLEATLGAEVARATGLKPGDRFAGVHGLGGGDMSDTHDATPYQVVGVLEATGTVIDRLILGSIESVWFVHMHPEPGQDPRKLLEEMHEDEKEVTALLVQYATPIAAATLPRRINAGPVLQAASPAFESARLFALIGAGVDVARGFALAVVLAAALSVFIALYSALEERRHDLAIMRLLGASPARILRLLMLEGAVLGFAGAVLGIGLGHVLAEILGRWLAPGGQALVSGAVFLPAELLLAVLSVLLGFLAAVVPAWRAYRTDVAAVLAGA